MGFNFPNAPSNGALFTPIAGGPTYTWDSSATAWKLASAGLSSGVYTGDIAPSNPVSGMLWLNSLTGIVYFWYVDPNSSQWVAISGGAPASVKTARTRNRVINPTFQISQENGTTGMTTSGAYPADQCVYYILGITGAAVKTTFTTPSPEGTTSCVALAATIAKASLAAADYMQVVLPVEGLDVADLGWGTAGAKPVVLRFCAICDTAGTYAVSLSNSAGNRTWLGSFTLTTAGVPQVFSFAIPGDVTGTWLVTNGIGVLIRFAPAFGSNYVGVAGWQAGGQIGLTGMTNLAAIINKFLYITDVGLYSDPDATGVAPRFEAPGYEDDLARCERYWERQYAALLVANTNLNQCSWAVPKRAVPSVTLTNIAAGTGATVNPTGNSGWYQSQAHSSAAQGDVTGNARLI